MRKPTVPYPWYFIVDRVSKNYALVIGEGYHAKLATNAVIKKN
jgi:hypothetical protein